VPVLLPAPLSLSIKQGVWRCSRILKTSKYSYFCLTSKIELNLQTLTKNHGPCHSTYVLVSRGIRRQTCRTTAPPQQCDLLTVVLFFTSRLHRRYISHDPGWIKCGVRKEEVETLVKRACRLHFSLKASLQRR
jgi:hypothetical protein